MRSLQLRALAVRETAVAARFGAWGRSCSWSAHLPPPPGPLFQPTRSQPCLPNTSSFRLSFRCHFTTRHPFVGLLVSRVQWGGILGTVSLRLACGSSIILGTVSLEVGQGVGRVMNNGAQPPTRFLPPLLVIHDEQGRCCRHGPMPCAPVVEDVLLSAQYSTLKLGY